MADEAFFDEVLRLSLDDSDFNKASKRVLDRIDKLSKELDAAFTDSQGKVTTLASKIDKITPELESAEQAAKGFLAPFDRLQKTVNNLSRLESKIKDLSNAARSNIVPQFDSGKEVGAQPKIVDPASALSAIAAAQRKRIKIVQDAVQQQVKIEIDGQDRVVRASIRGIEAERKIREKAEAETLREVEQGVLRRERIRQRANAQSIKEANAAAKERLLVAQREATEEIKLAERAAAAKVSALRRQQASIARSLTVGAAAAGAFGNFRTGSALFGIGSAIRGFDVESLRPGQSLLSGISSAAIKLVPLVGALTAGFAGLAATIKGITKGAELEQELAHASTLFNLGKASVSEFNAALESTKNLAIDISNQFNISTTEAIEGFKTALSAGIEVNELEVFSKEATTLSTALDTSFKKSTDLLTTLRDSYNLNISELSDLNAVLFNSIDEGKFVVDDLVNNLGRVAPIAATAGVSLKDLFGTLAFATRQGLKPTQAITSVAQFLEAVVDPSEKAKKVFKELGLQFGKTAIQGDGFVKFVNKLSGLSFEDLARLFPEDRALRFAAAVSNNTDQFRELVKVINDTDPSLAIEASARALDNTIDRVGSLKNAFVNELGDAGLRVLKSLTDAVLGLNDQMTALEKQKILQGDIEGVRSFTDQFITGFQEIFTLGNQFSASLLGSLTSAFSLGNNPISDYFNNAAESSRKAAADIQANFNDRLVESAKRLIDIGNTATAFEFLTKAEFSKESALKFIADREAGNIIERNTNAILEFDKALKGAVTNSAQEAASALGKTLNAIDAIDKKGEELRKKFAKENLTSAEKDDLKEIDKSLDLVSNRAEKTKLQIQQLIQAASADYASIIQTTLNDVSKAIKENGADKKNIAEKLLPSEFIEAVDTARKTVTKLFEKGIISEDATRNLRDVQQKFLDAITGGDIPKAQELGKNFISQLTKATSAEVTLDNGSINSLGVINSLSGERREQAVKLLGILQDQLDVQDKLKSKEQELVDIGASRPRNFERVQKAIEDTDKLLEKIGKKETKKGTSLFANNIDDINVQIAKYKELLALRVEQATVAKGNNETAEQALGFAEKAVDAQETLTALEKERDALLKDRVTSVDNLYKDIVKLEDEDKKAFEEFEKKKTEKLKEELDKRKDLVKDFSDIFKDINNLRVENAIDTAVGERNKLKVTVKERDRQLQRARDAISSGDKETFQEALSSALSSLATGRGFIDRQRSRGRFTEAGLAQIESVANQGRSAFLGAEDAKIKSITDERAPKIRGQEELLKQVLADRSVEFTRLDALTESLDGASVTIKGLAEPIEALTFVATSTKDFLQKLIEEQSNKQSNTPIAEASSTGTIINVTIDANNTNDPSIRKVIDGVSEAQQRGVFNNRFDKASNIKSVNPTAETRTQKARGGAFGS